MEAKAKALFVKTFEKGSKAGEGEDGESSSNKRDASEMLGDNCLCAIAPGRVNLIGEHTDYNDGFVMPLALEKATVAVARLRTDGSSECRIVSAYEEDNVQTFTLDDTSDSLVAGKDSSWAKYVKGVVKQYFNEIVEKKPKTSNNGQEGKHAIGFDAAFASDVPLGGGLSSSASLEVCTAAALEALYGIDSVNQVDRALRCVEAEHTFANVPCGIMDQFISSCAVEHCALLIDCRSKGTTRVNLEDPNIRIVVTNSNIKHQLSGSEYPDRVNQCKKAVEAIAKEFAADGKSRTHLRDVTLEELEKVKENNHIDEIEFKRARHGVSEDIRTQKAAAAAEKKDYKQVGALMIESHNSLRDDYEVSVPQIDYLVKVACEQPGVYGSRITGGGFGGCTVTLVETSKAEALIEALKKEYKAKFDLDCTCFSTKLGHGAQILWDRTQEKVKKSKA